MTRTYCEGSTSSRPMLEEEEEEMMEEMMEKKRRLRAMTAVAVGWQRWQALEAEVLRASGAWRVAEERCETTGEVAEWAEIRECEARSLAESARSGRLPITRHLEPDAVALPMD